MSERLFITVTVTVVALMVAAIVVTLASDVPPAWRLVFMVIAALVAAAYVLQAISARHRRG